MSLQLQSLAGLVALPAIAWLMSEQRAQLGGGRLWRLVIGGTLAQIVVAGAMLNIAALREAFIWPARMVAALQSATNEGTRLVFGYLAGAPAPFDVTAPQNGFILAFQALPIILLVSVLSRLLYHWGILQRVVGLFARVLERTLGVGGPVGTATAANIFVGMVEAPLLIRPYIGQLSRGELFAVMTAGMATIAGTVLALYASVLEPRLAGAAGHFIVASVISAPAALLIAALMVPDTPQRSHSASDTASEAPVDEPIASSMDAVSQGTREGILLLASVTAMLIVMIALVSLANQLLAFATAPFGFGLTLEIVVGWLFAPLALVIGIPLSECVAAGQLLGIKTILNELIAYLKLASGEAGSLSARSELILTYALCGFANLGSLGILVGGLVGIAPERRAEIAGLGMKSIIAGTLATLMTGAVVGLLTPA